MRIGTKSVLFGAHQFLIHPLFVALAWWKLFGLRRQFIGSRLQYVTIRLRHGRASFPRTRAVYASILSPRLWLAFVVHDLGYLGKPNMDGEEGELHPQFGAAILRFVCGEPWGQFVLYHSRFFAKKDGVKPSMLCFPDKIALTLQPRWLYLMLTRATGELREYMSKSAHNNNTGGKYARTNISIDDEKTWHTDCCNYTRRWVEEHKDGRADTWTPHPSVRAAS